MKKGIILAGGKGTRLYPITQCVSKQLLPIYDKPMIYYSLSTLMLACIRDVLIISTPQDTDLYKKLLGDGSDLGMNIKYEIQKQANGLAEAFLIGEEFIDEENVALILGDNFFYGQNFSSILKKATLNKGATIFLYPVKKPSAYGVVGFDKQNRITSIEEKPDFPKSDLAVTGLYFYDKNVCEYSKLLSPSSRGELEITYLNRIYLEEKSLNSEMLSNGFAWMDAGTFDGLQYVGQFVSSIQSRQSEKIGCIEEIAYNNGWINHDQIECFIKSIGENEYSNYLKKIIAKDL